MAKGLVPCQAAMLNTFDFESVAREVLEPQAPGQCRVHSDRGSQRAAQRSVRKGAGMCIPSPPPDPIDPPDIDQNSVCTEILHSRHLVRGDVRLDAGLSARNPVL